MKKPVLTIAGSDPSGGAGIQADLKTLSANNVFGMSVLTSITAQNTCGVSSVFHLPSSIIQAQLDAIFSDISVKTIKTGMLATVEIITTVSRALATQHSEHLVIDPVMVAKGGHVLLEDEAISTLKDKLCPQATLITPNIHRIHGFLPWQKVKMIRWPMALPKREAMAYGFSGVGLGGLNCIGHRFSFGKLSRNS